MTARKESLAVILHRQSAPKSTASMDPAFPSTVDIIRPRALFLGGCNRAQSNVVWE